MKKILCPEFYFAVYMVLFSLLAPVTHTMTSSSTMLIAIPTMMLCCCSLLTPFKVKSMSYRYCIMVSMMILYLILFEMAIRTNDAQSGYAYDFTVYGLIPIFLYSKVSDYRKCLKIYCLAACFVGIVHICDPLQGYLWNDNYMEYGFNAMLPAFIGSIVLSFFFKYRLFYLFDVVFLLSMIIGANKSSVISAIVFMAFAYVFIRHKNCKIKSIILLIVLAVMLLFSFGVLLTYFSDMADRLGIESYSLVTFTQMLNDYTSTTDSRTSIWNICYKLIDSSPIFGCGLGYFVSKYPELDYEHNLYLEILDAFGFIGLFVYVIIFYKSITSIISMKDNNCKVLAVTMLSLWLIPTISSLTYWKIMSFWAYFAICFCYRPIFAIHNNNASVKKSVC